MPVLSIKPGQQLPHQKVWLSPFLQLISRQYQQLAADIDKAHVQHTEKKLLQIHEDPWDNYLYYDSKYLLPLLCHQEALTIEQQVLLAFFI